MGGFFGNLLLVKCGGVLAAAQFLVKLCSTKKISWSLVT